MDSTPPPRAETAGDLTNHAWLRKVGDLATNTDLALLTLSINMTNIIHLLTQTQAHHKGDSEYRIIERWLEDIEDSTTYLDNQTKNKRGILSWIASITGLYNNLHINKMNQQISTLYQVDRALTNETNSLFHHVKINTQNLETIEKAARHNEAEIKDIDLLQNKREVWLSVRKTISALRNLIAMLPQHRLTHDAIFLFDLKKEWEKLQAKTQEKGKRVIQTTWQFLLHTKMSYWADRHRIIIALEIPITNSGMNRFDLYQLQLTPLLMNDRMYMAQIRHDFLAVHAKTQTTIALTKHQMEAETTKVGRTWYFHGPLVINHGDEKHCIEALWTGDLKEIEQWCHLIATRNKEHAQAVNSTAVLWMTNNPITITIQCTNHPTRIKNINKPTIFVIDPSCKATSHKLTFIPSATQHYHQETSMKRIIGNSTANKQTFPSWKLQQPTKLMDNFKTIQTALDHKYHLIPLWLSISLITITFFAILVFLVWLYIKAKHQVSPTLKIETPPKSVTNC